MYKALKGFSGLQLNMKRGEVRDIKDKSLVKDLLKAGYIEEVDVKNVDNKKLAQELEEANKKLAEVEAKLEEANKKLAETDEKSEETDEKSENTDEKSEKQ